MHNVVKTRVVHVYGWDKLCQMIRGGGLELRRYCHAEGCDSPTVYSNECTCSHRPLYVETVCECALSLLFF